MTNTPEELTAASYERVSSDEQAREGFSLEVQNERNRAFIAMQSWKFAGSYIDPGKSGKNLKRPEVQRLLLDIDRGIINIVVVHKLDRLTRNIGDLHNLLLLFEKKNVKLVSITENIDTSTAMGRMFVYMLGIFAQWYRENLSEEILKGQEKRAEKGLRISGTPPYGYSMGEDLSLEINEEEAEHIRKIFDLFLNGYGYRTIASSLNQIQSTKRWNKNSIKDVLTRRTYIGANSWKKKDDPEEKRKIVYERHDPIISLESFERAQNLVQRISDGQINMSRHEFPFSTVVKCGECGGSITGIFKDKKYVQYRCIHKSSMYDIRCPSSQIAGSKLDKLFLQFINSFDFTAPKLDSPIGDNKDAAREKKRLQKLIDDSLSKKKNYTRAMGNGKITYEEFEELVDEENKKLEEWNNTLSLIDTSTNTKTHTRRDIMPLINKLSESWSSMDRMQQKVLLNQIFEVIVIKKYPEGWKITGYKLAK